MKDKKGVITLGTLPQLALTVIFVAAIFVAGYLVMAGLGDATTDPSAGRAVANLTLTLDNIISYAPTWGIIIGVAVLIGIVLVGFMFGRERNMF